MINVGVFPSGSEVSIEIARALDSTREFNLIGLGSVPDYGDVAFKKNLSYIPFYTNKKFLEVLANTVKDNKIRFLIPGMDEVAYLLKINEKDIGCEVVYSNVKTSKIIRQKSSTYSFLKDFVPTPKIYDLNFQNNKIDFPIFCKPDIGYGSRGAIHLDSMDDFEKLSKFERAQNIFMELLPGEELTVDCFSNKESNVLFIGPRKRNRVRLGISVSTRPYELTEEIEKFARKISKELLMTGCWFFQIKKDIYGNFKLLEVAARVSGSMAMYRLLGLNFILLDLYQRLGKNIRIPKLLSRKFRLERAFDVNLVGKLYFDSVYVDLDDCLIQKNKVSTKIVSFLYACRNKSIPVFLITRHKKNLSETLTKFALKDIFYDIFHLTNGDAKSKYIKHKNPIFIDDSFAERKEVSENLNCYVAAPDMINLGLLND